MLTIVIPALNEERHIAATLASFSDCCADYEIIVSDGGSKDGTCAIVAAMSEEDARIRLIENRRRIQAAGVNLAAAHANTNASCLLRADAHCIYPMDFVARLLAARMESNADSIVVPMRTVGASAFQRALAALQNSRMGNGGARHRMAPRSGYVDHGHHALFDLSRFRSLGGYDETFSHNEDAEYDIRLRDAGGKIWLEASAEIEYVPRSNMMGLARQYFHYGKGRARTFLKHGRALRMRQMAPLAILFTCVGGLLAAFWHPAFLLLPAAYAALCILGAIRISFRMVDIAGLISAPAAMTMHLAWAIGFVRGMLGRRPKGDVMFKVRSQDRDGYADNLRLRKVVKEIDAAIESATAERNGLATRMESTTILAANLGGNDAYGEGRSSSEEASLLRVEQEMRAGNDRLVALDAQIAALRDARALIQI